MENNENGFENNPYSGDDGGYTQAPSGYNMNGQPGQPMGGNPYGQPPQQGSQGFAIAGMVLGILSLVCCCSGYIALVLGVVGMVLSIVSLVQKRPGKGMAIAGIVCSAVAIVLIIVLTSIGNSITPEELQNMLKEIEDMQ